MCHWTRDDFECVKIGTDEVVTFIPPVDYEVETCGPLFESDEGPDDEFPNGTWKVVFLKTII